MEEPNQQTSKWGELFFKVLSALVMPILAWAIHLQVSLAVMTTEITALKEARSQTQESLAQVTRQYEGVRDEVRAMGGSIREIQVTTQYVRETVTEMRNEVRNAPTGRR